MLKHTGLSNDRDKLSTTETKNNKIVFITFCYLSNSECHIYEACYWYQLSSEELASWEVAFKQSGVTGLRASYRLPEIRASPPLPVGFDRDRGLSGSIFSEN
jgi:hypothetical protein